MINTVIIAGKIVDVFDQCQDNTLCVIEVNDEQFYVLFNPLSLPDPNKIKNKYVCITGYLKKFKFKLRAKHEFKIETGIFVRRLEVYDI